MGLENILAVIVLYKCSLSESESFQTLLHSIKGHESPLTIFIYNNSPDYWRYSNETFEGVLIVNCDDYDNSGVSKAYNTAFQYAKKENISYMLLLDQDTSLPASFFHAFFDSKRKHAVDSSLFCPIIVSGDDILSPAKFFLYTTKKLGSVKIGVQELKGLAIINSGLIISTKHYESVGGYNEKIKLDFSDFDFLKRSLKSTKNIVIFGAKCQHSLSSETEVTLKSAINRFDYYIEGAIHYDNNKIKAVGLGSWVILRALKLNWKYKTTSFTGRLFSRIGGSSLTNTNSKSI